MEDLQRERAAWDTERGQLVASLQDATAARAEAERDRDFVKKQYDAASAYVMSTRAEAEAASARAGIAERQAKDGVALVRATLEGQLARAQSEAGRWRGMHAILLEKDRRTGDEVRRRAGAEPELRRRVGELEKRCEEGEGELEVLREAYERGVRERGRWGGEADNWRAELVRMQGELEGARRRLREVQEERGGAKARGTQMMMMDAGASAEAGDLVYRCQWRTPGSAEGCEEVFGEVEVCGIFFVRVGRAHC